jgi:hypothetical protein
VQQLDEHNDSHASKIVSALSKLQTKVDNLEHIFVTRVENLERRVACDRVVTQVVDHNMGQQKHAAASAVVGDRTTTSVTAAVAGRHTRPLPPHKDVSRWTAAAPTAAPTSSAAYSVTRVSSPFPGGDDDGRIQLQICRRCPLGSPCCLVQFCCWSYYRSHSYDSKVVIPKTYSHAWCCDNDYLSTAVTATSTAAPVAAGNGYYRRNHHHWTKVAMPQTSQAWREDDLGWSDRHTVNAWTTSAAAAMGSDICSCLPVCPCRRCGRR